MTFSEKLEIDSKATGVISENPAPLIAKAFGITDKGPRASYERRPVPLWPNSARRCGFRQTSLVEPKLHVGEERATCISSPTAWVATAPAKRASALTVTGDRAVHAQFLQVVFRA